MYIKYYTHSFMRKALARLDRFKPNTPLHNQGVQQSLPQPIWQILIFNDIDCDVMDMGYSSYFLSYMIHRCHCLSKHEATLKRGQR